jgi:hypothetical protein
VRLPRPVRDLESPCSCTQCVHSPELRASTITVRLTIQYDTVGENNEIQKIKNKKKWGG